MKTGLATVLVACVCVGGSGCSDTAATATSATTLDTSFTFATTITANGAASRTFSTYNAGTITATLSSVTPAIVLGVGIGIPRSDGGGCLLTTSVEASSGASPQLSIRADGAATYCVRVFDVGRIPEQASFSLLVTHE